MTIRPENESDIDAVRGVNALAFGQEDEGALVDALRAEGYARVSLVAESDAEVVGHILFSEIAIRTESGPVAVLSLAPMSVLPEVQNTGVGSRLVREGLDQCRALDYGIVLVLGHPTYYPRFGFSATLTAPLDAPFSGESFMALELAPGALENLHGTVEYSPPFGI